MRFFSKFSRFDQYRSRNRMQLDDSGPNEQILIKELSIAARLLTRRQNLGKCQFACHSDLVTSPYELKKRSQMTGTFRITFER